MKALVLTAALAVSSIPANAELPREAYAGSIGPRITQPFKCIGGYVVLPAFMGTGQRAGTYVWFNAATGMCEVGGSAKGPQF